jgi:hypothetical protein
MLWNKAISAGQNKSYTRGVFGGGGLFFQATVYDVMDYITISTAGNATSFGLLTTARSELAGVSNGPRGVFGGGQSNGTLLSVMDYITISTAGNATNFGNLTLARRAPTGVSSNARGVFGGGNPSGGTGTTYTAVMDYITIATTGNATNFGNLTLARQFLAGSSGY